MAWAALGTQRAECVLGVGRVAGQRLLDFFVDDDIDLDAPFSSSLDGLVESPFLAKVGRSTKEDLGRQPPVLDVDGFSGVLDAYRYGPEVVSTVYIPFDLVVLSLGKEGLEAMALTYSCALAIGLLLVFFVVAMVGIEKITELSDFVLEMKRLNFSVIQFRVCAFVSVKKRQKREHVPLSLSRRAFMLAFVHELCESMVASTDTSRLVGAPGPLQARRYLPHGGSVWRGRRGGTRVQVHWKGSSHSADSRREIVRRRAFSVVRTSTKKSRMIVGCVSKVLQGMGGALLSGPAHAVHDWH